MENTSIPKALQRLLIVFGALLVVSLLASGFSAVYVTLAAPQRSTYVPSTVGFEGQLADSEGAPVADGNYAITFTLYNAATGGTAVWDETQQTVNVKDGLYSVQLGLVDAFEADDFSGARWLAVKVGSDAEMEPRIPVSAVPFALNAEQARGLQGNPVADTAPETDDALMWNGSAWVPQGMTFPDLAPVGSNASPNDLLQNYRSGAILRWEAADTVEVSAGELMVNGLMRRNTSAVDVKFAGDAGGNGPNLGLDTGTAQNDTTYYIYAVADDAESTFDLIISANNSDDEQYPIGVTNFRKLASFKTETGTTNILLGSVTNVIEAAAEYPRRAFGFHMNSTAVIGGSIATFLHGGHYFNFQCYQSPAHNGDTFTNSFTLQAGSYTLYALGTLSTAGGKVDWYVDDALQISGQNWYSSSNTPNVVKSGIITVTGDGYHVLKGVVNGTTAGSNGYMISLTAWWIAPVSD